MYCGGMSPIGINYSRTVLVVYDDGVCAIRIDYSCAVAVMYCSGMSPIGINYSCTVPVVYDDGVRAIRIDDNSMLCICG